MGRRAGRSKPTRRPWIGFALIAGILACACDRNPSGPMLRPQPCPSCPSGPVTLVDYPYDISPDESLVVYGHLGTPSLPSGVYVVGLAPGSQPRYLMPYVHPANFDPWGLRFSPDGKRLAYARGGYHDLWVFDLETMEERRVTFTNGNAQAGDWDPSGRFLVYPRPDLAYGAPDTSAGIFVVDTETLNDRPLLHDGQPTYGGHPRWSPDSTRIAFWYGTAVGRSSAIHLYTVRVDGTEYRDLMPSSLHSADSQEWIRGDERILYESYDRSSRNVHVTRVMDPGSAESGRWPADLRLFVNRISRDGSHYVYTYPDAVGNGVVYIQETQDITGATRRQITSFEQSSIP
jgi:Tol biopolymer transport system component